VAKKILIKEDYKETGNDTESVRNEGLPENRGQEPPNLRSRRLRKEAEKEKMREYKHHVKRNR
jgi:hypothetical protein